MSRVLKKGRWLGILIALGSYSYIIYRLFQFQNQLTEFNLQKFFDSKMLLVLGLQCFLLWFNILLESKKWQLLIQRVKTIPLTQSIKMVLSGFASGIFTPAKIGEPVGRIQFLEKPEWGKATILNYLGGAIHNLAIFTFATPCLLIFNTKLVVDLSILSQLYVLSILLIIGVIALLWSKRDSLIEKISIAKKYKYAILILKQISATSNITMLKAYIFSVLRFMVYCTQLCLFLWAIGIDIHHHIIFIIPIYFMLITIAPSFFLLDLGIRSSVAMFLFSELQLPDATILVAIFSLWILNQAIPALIGSVFLIRKK